MNQKVLSKVFIWGFLFLYFLVAGISFCHAVQFFNIGNVLWMASTLAFAFELGLALSLAAILLSDENKKNKLPWILMIILTFVQVVGNVYSTFKYISLSDVDYYIYLQKPLLFWIEEISQETVQIIISWIIGAILPIVALFMTDMVASNMKIVYMSNDNESKSNENDILENSVIDDKEIKGDNDEDADDHLKDDKNVNINETHNNEVVDDVDTSINDYSLDDVKEFEDDKKAIIEPEFSESDKEINKLDTEISVNEIKSNDNNASTENKDDANISNEITEENKNHKIKRVEVFPKTISTHDLKDQDIDRKDIPDLSISKDKIHTPRIVPNELITSSVK